jgi:PAS domain S-box-containing protein
VKIQFKLILASFVVIVILMAVIGFVQIRTSQRISEHLDTVDRLSDAKASLVDPAVHAIGHLSTLNEKTLSLYYQYAVGTKDVKEDVEKLHREFNEELKELDLAAAADIDPLVGEAISHIAEELRPVQALHTIYDNVHTKQFSFLKILVEDERHDEAENYVLNTISLNVEHIGEILSSIDEHLGEESEHVAGLVEDAIHDANAAAAAAAGRILIVGIIASVLLALGMGVFVSRGVARPLKELQHVAAQIIAGDYSVRAKVSGRDEIAELAKAFNAMTDSLIESRKLPENILRSMSDSLFVVDTNGNITEVNQAGLDVLGYKKEELVGKPLSRVLKSASVKKGSQKPQVQKVERYVPQSPEVVATPAKAGSTPAKTGPTKFHVTFPVKKTAPNKAQDIYYYGYTHKV